MIINILGSFIVNWLNFEVDSNQPHSSMGYSTVSLDIIKLFFSFYLHTDSEWMLKNIGRHLW